MKLLNTLVPDHARGNRQQDHGRALRYLTLTVFLLFAAPRARLSLGPVPFYFIDGLTVLTIYYALRLPGPGRSPFRALVLLIFAAAFLSELFAALRMGTLLEPIYLIVRTFLAVSLFFLIPRVVRQREHLETLLKAALSGVLITSALVIITAVPQTRDLALKSVFSLPVLEPAYEEVTSVYDYRASAAGRGRSLVGVSILSAAFLNTILPALYLLRARQPFKWKLALATASILVPTAVVMSYSRGAIIGLILLVCTVLLLNARRVRRPLVFGVAVSLMLFYWIGWQSEYFYFERFEITTQNILANPDDNVSLNERLDAYPQPFQHLVQNPEFLFLGQGFARRTVGGHNLTAGADAATHAVFAAAYYSYGMLAALAYLALMFGNIVLIWRHIQRSRNKFSSAYSRALLAGLMGCLSWFLLGHAGVSEPRGAMLLFLLFGLVAAQPNFDTASVPERQYQPLDFTARLKLRYGISAPSTTRIP